LADDNEGLLQVYPSKVARCAARVALFSWRFVIPLVIFVVCYWKIISALSHQAKVAASHRDQPVAGPSTSTVAGVPRGPKLPSKTQKNVVKTMIVIISLFTVCWLPFQFTYMVLLCGLRVYSFTTLYAMFAVIAMVNLCANPFIYATGLYQFLRVQCVVGVRRLMCRENQVANSQQNNRQ